ncbi:DUF4253 domain-containing protein [Streptomyces sp. S07_1.15]|uniref:DUF4253 domain-containing protein n=1 Tax=Streptomyces sp. S07_1.15 TaxID=2873925 RepID=UPI001D13A668|nr:DUF4253 domain-containing protein [Streptomyces sp. S07_1.15]MCC3650620.1 DUF4253 domain-containing protein [Streptomyces sp. S07_1.15]
MSWDVLLLRLPDEAASLRQIPDDYASAPLGSRDDVLAAITRAVPEADLSDPTWGQLLGPTWSMELNIGSEDPVDSIMLHIRGSGDDVLDPVFRLADVLRCKVLDCAEGELITPRQTSGWHTFQQYRDSAVWASQQHRQPPLPAEPGRNLGTPLPPGRLITSDEGDGDVQPLWLSDRPATAGLWARIHAEHTRSGLWPLLLDTLDPGDDACRPWGSGEIFLQQMSSPTDHEPAGLLAEWWAAHTAVDEDDDALSAEQRLAETAPYGQRWPGIAPGRQAVADADDVAAEYAQAFLADRPQARLGLVVAASGAEALTAAGWSGPANYDNDTAKFSAVIRDWEHRFGACVVAVGFSTLHLSVAAPPMTQQDALLVAAEHFAFCPDNIWQGTRPYTLAAYAEQMTGVHNWDFWWD